MEHNAHLPHSWNSPLGNCHISIKRALGKEEKKMQNPKVFLAMLLLIHTHPLKTSALI
jgi:hypothetical protein